MPDPHIAMQALVELKQQLMARGEATECLPILAVMAGKGSSVMIDVMKYYRLAQRPASYVVICYEQLVC